MDIESRLLSKCLDLKDISILNKYSINSSSFRTQSEAFKFIQGYVKEYSETPPSETVEENCEHFEYEAVEDNIAYLAKEVKNSIARLMTYELIQEKAAQKYQELSGTQFVDWLSTELEKVKVRTKISDTAGIDFATSGEIRKQMYLERKENVGGIFIPTPFPTLNTYLDGGMEISDYILLQASTNVGKSWLSSLFAVTAWQNDFGVLYYSPELSRSQQLNRLDTLNGHHSNTGLKKGNLYTEDRYFKYLEDFTEKNTTPFIVKCMEDLPMGLSVKTIEADLKIHEGIKFVVIDGLNLMVHGGSENMRNRMTDTSRQLRQLFSRHAVVGLIVHQSKKSTAETDDVETAILNPPTLNDYSETRACIQDSAVVLGFDAKDGCGRIFLAKSRSSTVDKMLDITTDFDRGYIKEVDATNFF
jgi:replicative DNA helicase